MGNDAPLNEAHRKAMSRHSLVPACWWIMAPAQLAGVALISLASLSLPRPLTAAMLLAGILTAAAATLMARIEQGYALNDRRRHLVMVAAIGLPMLCFGGAVARWAAELDLRDWRASLAALVAASCLAAILLESRLVSIVTANLALWLGVSLIAGTPATLTMLVAAALASRFIALRHTRIAAAEEAQHRERDRAQRRAGEILRDYERSGQGWFWETDRRGLLTYVSPTVGAVLHRDATSLLGRPFSEMFILDNGGPASERTLTFQLSARSAFQDLPMRAATPLAEERWWSISGRPLHDDFANFIGFRGSGSDLTERRRSQRRASRLALYDSLTGLANRMQMSESLEKILAQPREDQRGCAVLLLDLDRFKQVNDTLGHPAGDALLTQVAQRLERTVDTAGRVGRLGGDEFQVILPGPPAHPDLVQLAGSIIANLSQPYSIEGHRVLIGASIGIALSPEDGASSQALLRNADLALYAAKDGGRGRHHFYAEDLHNDAQMRRQLEQDLRDATAGGELELHYQPVVQTATNRITGFEALLRWTHPLLGPLSPAKFIPIAEDTGLIAPIGEWVLRTACERLAAWPESVRVAVNVSPLQFANPALPAIVTSALNAAQVTPDRLELEITESVFLQDDRATEAMFAALKRVGVRLALDDFGTGYSSLGYLKRAPFDKIKIDQSFVRGATIPGSRNGAIIRAIVSLAEALGMETTAEGVETLDELDLVRALGCSQVQGYIYAKPLSAADASARLADGPCAIASGPRSARPPRQTMLRRVELEHDGRSFDGTIRNVSAKGAMIECAWPAPAGDALTIRLSSDQAIVATARWSKPDRMGVEFARALPSDGAGTIVLPVASSLPRSR
ncbi:MAG: EAL domain-containing protein [Novosphingobium sp.]